MRWLALLLCSLLLLIGVVAAITLTPEVGDVGGAPHERFSTMARGGSGFERHENVLELGGLFGAGCLLFFTALMAFGARKGSSARGLAVPLLLTLGLNLGCWFWILVRYWDDASPVFFLALPIPVAIMIYGLFPSTILFNLLYVLGYRRWILTDEDFEAYERLLAKRRERST
jgi:hypothetical protein